MKLEYSVLSDKMAFIHNVPIDGKIDKYMIKFIQEEHSFSGKVTVFKGTKYFESNGKIYQRQYKYEVERGKYRKNSLFKSVELEDCSTYLVAHYEDKTKGETNES